MFIPRDCSWKLTVNHSLLSLSPVVVSRHLSKCQQLIGLHRINKTNSSTHVRMQVLVTLHLILIHSRCDTAAEKSRQCRSINWYISVGLTNPEIGRIWSTSIEFLIPLHEEWCQSLARIARIRSIVFGAYWWRGWTQIFWEDQPDVQVLKESQDSGLWYYVNAKIVRCPLEWNQNIMAQAESGAFVYSYS